MPIGVMAASVPPVTMTSASSYWMALHGVADGVGGAGAGGGDGRVRAAQAVLDRDVAAGRVDHQLGNREGRDLVRALVEQPRMLRFDFVQPADAGAENDAAAKRIFLREIEARVAHRVDAGHQGELREAIEPLLVLGGDIVAGRPIVDFAAEADFVLRGVEQA